MPQIDPFVTRLRFALEVDRRLQQVRIGVAGEPPHYDYLVLSVDDVPAIRDLLTDAIERHPDLFPLTHTRRVG